MQNERRIVIIGELPSSEIFHDLKSIASAGGFQLTYHDQGPETITGDVDCFIQYSLSHRPCPSVYRLLRNHHPQLFIIASATGDPEPGWGTEIPQQNEVELVWTNIQSLPDTLREVIKALDLSAVERLRKKLYQEFGLRQLIGSSPIFQEVLLTLPKIARSAAPVLITGETGTGKEACARAIHYLSSRTGRAFIPINCSAIPDHLFENEFFGHKRGAFTDAHFDEPGILSQAGGGTIFLDEITSLPLTSQAKILRLFEEGSFRPLGAHTTLDVTVRFIVATNLDIHQEVREGRFRKDLLYRVNVLWLSLPSLRERGGDEIEELARYFMAESAANNGKSHLDLSPDAVQKLRRYQWPGNLRELKNIIERAVVLTNANLVGPEAIECECHDRISREQCSFKEARRLAIQEFERESLARGIGDCGHNVSQLSKQLSLDRRTVQRLLQKYRIPFIPGVR
jgi:two-component system response regulator GlrR